MSAQPTAAGVPERIGARYQVLERLGRGGMAVVYRVRDPSRSGELALKQLTPSRDAQQAREQRALFEREWRTLTQLSHPSLIEAHDFGFDPHGPYYTMELLDGGDLATRAPLDPRQACALFWQVCSSLSLLHARGLVHRDISPRNIRCTRDGRAKLIDFGALADMGPSSSTVGTPAFVAPEVLQQAALDARTDLFSLGATLYFALTGRPAFVVRTFAELREAWRVEPVPPSQLVAGVPASLDALVLELLRIDPARRPRSAFEVMQRLAAAGELAQTESELVSRAYLSNPRLVGRDVEQRRFRQQLRSALQGRGGGCAIEGAPGLGRSRLLDAHALEAKTLGATLLRVAGGASTKQPFAAAQQLATQLLAALPELAARCASSLSFASLAELQLERHALLAALGSWIQAVAREAPLLIAVDDVERIDEASLALLAVLTHAAREARLLILYAGMPQPGPGAPAALGVLRDQCARQELAPLTAAQIELLFGSVFGAVPSLTLVSEYIAQLAQGNPRESLALAHQLLEHGSIRYVDGQWILPDREELRDLPASADEAWNARIASLSPLALRLLRSQALALSGVFARADYQQLAAAEPVDDALLELQRQGLLRTDAQSYRIAQPAYRPLLIAPLTEAERVVHHRALAALCVQRRRPALFEVHNLLLAGEQVRALDRLDELIRSLFDQTDLLDHSGLPPDELAGCLSRAFDAAQALGRPLRELHELARTLTGLSLFTHPRYHQRHAPAWLARLTADSGLDDYRELAALPPEQRLPAALQRATARYAATPEAERVYRVDEAIKYLARYAVISLAVATRRRDLQLLASLPGLLEPFAALSPLLHALWQYAIAVCELTHLARIESARVRCIAVYESLKHVTDDQFRYVEMLRDTVAYAVAAMETTLGRPSHTEWIELLEQDPRQRARALSLRGVACLDQGDVDGAERYRKQAEVLAVQISAQLSFGPVAQDLIGLVRARDLAGVRREADRMLQLAEEEPGWLAPQQVAEGWFQRFRGDQRAALAAFERSFALNHPATHAPACLWTWSFAAIGAIGSLTDLGRAAEARELGNAALELCRTHELENVPDAIARELALAESSLGDHTAAAERLDAMIARRSGLLPGYLGVDYEARARVAIRAVDAAAAVRFAQLATRDTRAGHGQRLLSHQGGLLDEARRAGIDLHLEESGFTSAVLGARRTHVPAAVSGETQRALAGLRPAARAARMLELLCQAAQLEAGHLYAAHELGLHRLASHAAAADAALDAFASGYFNQQREDALYSAALSQISAASSDGPPLGHWTAADGTRYGLLILTQVATGAVQYSGLAAFVMPARRPLPAEARDLARALAGQLAECSQGMPHSIV